MSYSLLRPAMGESELMVIEDKQKHSIHVRELSPNPHDASMEVLQVLIGVHEVHV